MVSLTIPDDASAVGKTLAELGMARQLNENDHALGDSNPFPESFPCVVVRGGKPMAPAADMALEAGDELFAVTTSEEESDFYEKLTGIW